MFMILIILSFFDRKIKYNQTYTGGVIAAGLIGTIQALAAQENTIFYRLFHNMATWTYSLPLTKFGLEWLLPALITALIFTLGAAIKDRLVS